MKRQGILFVFSAPSGTGKTTICREVQKIERNLVFSVSYTSRPRRTAERDGEAYWFVTREKFEELIEEGAFVEWAEVHGNYYGTPKGQLISAIERGQDVLLDIDVQGARSIRSEFPDNSVLIFILPPSFSSLEQRLRERKTDSARTIERRLEAARRELSSLPRYDYFVVNDDLPDAVASVSKVIDVERRRIRYYGFPRDRDLETVDFRKLRSFFRY